MARGTQHLKKRPKAAAATATAPKRTRSEVRRERRIEESGMFFPMLRRQAKWMFVLLALVFAGGFVFFGVGTGSNGIGDVLSGWINGNGSSADIGKLEAAARKHPRDAQAFRDLASAYEGKQETKKAIGALERYTALRPRDEDALQELAGLYQQRLTAMGQEFQTIAAAPVASADPFQPASSTTLGKAYASLSDPIAAAVTGYVQQRQLQIADDARTVAKRQEQTYLTLVELDPTDPGTQFQLGAAAAGAGDTATAIAAYKQAAKLDPSTYGSAAKQALAQLQPAPASSGSGGK